MRRSGFTFIEVIGVVVLLGLLAGSTAWMAARDAQRGSHENVLGQIAHADAMARMAARRLGRPCAIRFDLEAGTIRRVGGPAEAGGGSAHAVRLAAGHRIDRIVLPRAAGEAGPGGRAGGYEKKDAGVVEVAYSTGGQSLSYALHVISPDHDAWMVFAGLTGQVTLADDQKEVDNLFARLTTGRPDAP